MTQTVDRFNEYCKEYDSLKENQLYYRKEIQELIQLLNEKLTSHYGKTIEVKPLCEYIEVKDEKWRNALEGYLNSQRFDLIIEPEYFEYALLVYEEYKNKSYAWQLAVKTNINELLLIAVRQMPVREADREYREYSKIKNILEFVAQHYCEKITLRQCAEQAGFNTTYLSRYFSQHMGVTFQEYIKQLRIEKAKWLIMTEQLSIMEICYQSGFGDIKTFNKEFRQICGMTPTEFKKSLLI